MRGPCAAVSQLFSELSMSLLFIVSSKNLPSCPDCVNVHALSNVNDELDVGVVVVVGATGDLDVLVRHADVVCVGRQVLGSGHDGELDGALIAQCLVCPLPHGADLFDGGDTVIRNQNLPSVSELGFPSRKAPPSSGGIQTYAGDNCVTIARGDKVLDLAGRGLGQLAAADEMRGKVEFGSVAAGSTIGVAIGLG